MRTALILLLLLAIAAVPGSVFPQRTVSIESVNAYLADNPAGGEWLDRLGFFDVYSSPWFSAIYLLLFISLVGCLVPRLRQHIANLVSAPPDAPSRVDRLPHSAERQTDLEPTGTAATLKAALRRRRWRAVAREHPDGSVTVSAEKGYLKETGNLAFHFALLALLVGVAWGSWYGWHGNRLLQAGADYAFCNSLQQYDEYGLGARATSADLPGFCVTLHDFEARYLDNGQPVRYSAEVSYIEELGGPERRKRLAVNDPLRLDGANLYLLGHGYAPILRYTDRYGVTQTSVTPFLPRDDMLTSTGVAKFPDANVDPSGRTPRDPSTQVGFAGVYVPTLPDRAPTDPADQRSAHPAEHDPALMLSAYVGNLGLGTGEPQSVYDLSHTQIASGQLTEVADAMLRPGDVWTLPDGSRLEFAGTQQWITVSVRHDPGGPVVFAGAGTLLAGLMLSLAGKRRRVWARVTPAGDGRSVVTLGGLARTEYPGFVAEFAGVVALVDAPDQAGTQDNRPVKAAAGERGQ
jgi:cytochrome c biogenesis protein